MRNRRSLNIGAALVLALATRAAAQVSVSYDHAWAQVEAGVITDSALPVTLLQNVISTAQPAAAGQYQSVLSSLEEPMTVGGSASLSVVQTTSGDSYVITVNCTLQDLLARDDMAEYDTVFAQGWSYFQMNLNLAQDYRYQISGSQQADTPLVGAYVYEPSSGNVQRPADQFVVLANVSGKTFHWYDKDAMGSVQGIVGSGFAGGGGHGFYGGLRYAVVSESPGEEIGPAGAYLDLTLTLTPDIVTDAFWLADVDGAFGDPARWDIAAVPGEDHRVVFDHPLESPYAVDFTGNAHTARLLVRSGTVQFNLEGTNDTYLIDRPWSETSGASVLVGHEGQEASLAVTGGRIESRDVMIGQGTANDTASFGRMLVDQQMTSWSARDSVTGQWYGLLAGVDEAMGMLSVTSGAYFEAGHSLLGWRSMKSQATIVVQGTSEGGNPSTLHIDGYMGLGIEGQATMSVKDGATVDIGRLSMAELPGSRAQLEIDGSMSGTVTSLLHLHAGFEISLVVGNAGNAEVIVSNGGRIVSDGGITLGNTATGIGTMVINGAAPDGGATIENLGMLTVGGESTGDFNDEGTWMPGGRYLLTQALHRQYGATVIGRMEYATGTMEIGSGGLFIVDPLGAGNASAQVLIGNGPGSIGTLLLCGGGRMEVYGTGSWIKLGEEDSSHGEVEVIGEDSVFYVEHAPIVVGSSGFGFLNIVNQGVVHGDGGELFVGWNPSGYGQVNVANGTLLITSDYASEIGMGGSGNLNITNGGLAVIDSGLFIATRDFSVDGETHCPLGTVAVMDPNSSLWTGYLSVGTFGNGQLEILNEAYVDIAGDMVIGEYGGAQGELLVDGNGSWLWAGGTLRVGNQGIGRMHLTHGGLVEVGQAVCVATDVNAVFSGEYPDPTDPATFGSGIVIDGAGEMPAMLCVYGTADPSNVIGLEIGSGGVRNAMAVLNGGQAHVDFAATVGGMPGSEGWLLVSGINSGSEQTLAATLASGFQLEVGRDGRGEVLITEGGQLLVDDDHASLADSGMAVIGIRNQGAVEIRGTCDQIPSTLSTASQIQIGQAAGAEGSLSVKDGAVVLSRANRSMTGTAAILGVDGADLSDLQNPLPAAVGHAEIAGHGALWHLTGGMTVGWNGQGYLSVADGGRINTCSGVNDSGPYDGTIYVARGAGSIGTIEVLGTGLPPGEDQTLLTIQGAVHVGYQGSATMGVSNGGVVICQSASVATLPESSGSLTVSHSTMTIVDDLYIGAAGGNATYARVTVTGEGASITQSGAGALTIGHATTGTAILEIYSGGLFTTGTGLATINTTGTLEINGGEFVANGTMLFQRGADFSLGGMPGAWSGRLDLKASAGIVQTTDATDKADKAAFIANLIHSASAGGTWIGHGITSSTAATDPANYGVGLFDNAALGKTTFGGLDVDADALLVSIAHLGNANADDIVDIVDLAIVANNWQQNQNTWSSGDLNCDGMVDIVDLAIVANNWQQAGDYGLTPGPLQALPLDVTQGAIGDGSAAAITVMPEPASVGLVVLGCPLLVLRRRRLTGPAGRQRSPNPPTPSPLQAPMTNQIAAID